MLHKLAFSIVRCTQELPVVCKHHMHLNLAAVTQRAAYWKSDALAVPAIPTSNMKAAQLKLALLSSRWDCRSTGGSAGRQSCRQQQVHPQASIHRERAEGETCWLERGVLWQAPAKQCFSSAGCALPLAIALLLIRTTQVFSAFSGLVLLLICRPWHQIPVQFVLNVFCAFQWDRLRFSWQE